jgi:hypothetical protein
MRLFGYYLLPEEQVDSAAEELRKTRKKLRHERFTNQKLRQEYKHMVEYVADVKKLLKEETKDEREGTEPGSDGGAGPLGITPG